MPTHAGWPSVQKWLDANPDALRLIRLGAEKPHMGFILSSTSTTRVPLGRDGDESNAGYALDGAGRTRQAEILVNILRAHARLSRLRDDGESLSADMNALLQMGLQWRTVPSISAQRSLEPWHGCIDELERTLFEKPRLLSHAQLAALARRLSGPTAAGDFFDISSERARFLNALQFAYTDDGKNGGRLTKAGLWAFGRNWDIRAKASGCFPDPIFTAVQNWMTAPAAYLCSMSRQQERQTFEGRFADEQKTLSIPMRDKPTQPPAMTDEEYSATQWSYARHFVAYQFLNNDDAAFRSLPMAAECVLARRDGVLIGIALELHRRKTGLFPSQLAELELSLLCNAPVDRITGGPLSYRLVNGKPVIYSVGCDHDDDSGRAPLDDDGYPNGWWAAGWGMIGNPPDGDWVIYSDPGPYRPEVAKDDSKL